VGPVVNSIPATPWTLYLSWTWEHGGSNDYSNYTLFPKVFQDWWTSGQHLQITQAQHRGVRPAISAPTKPSPGHGFSG
jgi:hypothetical protein